MSTPVFTVIITTYKRPEYLKEAVESVRSQNYKDFECLVINDCPEDNGIIETFLNGLEDQRFKFIKSAQNKGGNYCRNKGISLAAGAFIAFLDDDDIWFPEKLECHYQRHRETGASLVFSRYMRKERGLRGSEVLSVGPEVPSNIARAMFEGRFSIGTTSAVTLARKDLPDPFFDEQLVSFQDWDAWVSLALNRRETIFSEIKKPLLYFMQHDLDRTSGNPVRREKGLMQVVDKYGGKKALSGFYYKELMNLLLLKVHSYQGSSLKKKLVLISKFLICPGLWWRIYSIKRTVRYLLWGR